MTFSRYTACHVRIDHLQPYRLLFRFVTAGPIKKAEYTRFAEFGS